MNIPEIISALAAIFTACIAWKALSMWKVQLHGTDKYLVAKKLRMITYRIEDDISDIRRPLTQISKEDIEELGVSLAQKREYEVKFKVLFDDLRELRVLEHEMRIYFGKDSIVQFEGLKKLSKQLKGNLWLYFWYDNHAKMLGHLEKNEKNAYDEAKKIIEGFEDTDDAFWSEIKIEVEKIEDFLVRNS